MKLCENWHKNALKWHRVILHTISPPSCKSTITVFPWPSQKHKIYVGYARINEPRHDKTKKIAVRQAKTQISLGIRQVWSESSLCTQWVAKDPKFLQADSEDSDQTGQMPRLIWVIAGHTLILLVLSCRGSSFYLCQTIFLVKLKRK